MRSSQLSTIALAGVLGLGLMPGTRGGVTQPAFGAPDDIVDVECTGPGTVVDLGSPVVNGTTLTVDNDAPTAFLVGTTVITWTFADAGGFTFSDTQTVTVVDTAPPDLGGPTAIVVEGNTLGGHDGNATDLQITGTDLCGEVSVSRSQPGPLPLGDHVVVWTADDGHGNTVTLTQNVTVQDTTPPIVQGPSSLIVDGDEANVLGLTGGCGLVDVDSVVTAFDVVDGDVSGGLVYSPALVPDPLGSPLFIFEPGVTPLSYQVSDSAGNTSSAGFAITVNNALEGTGVTLTLRHPPQEIVVEGNVLTSGHTTVQNVPADPPPPDGFVVVSRAFAGSDYFDISTTATHSGPIDVTASYDDTALSAQQEANIRMHHFEGGEFVDVTSDPHCTPGCLPNDIDNNFVRGQVDSFSLFALFMPKSPEVTAPISIDVDADTIAGAGELHPEVAAFIEGWSVRPRGAGFPFDVTTRVTFPDGSTRTTAGTPEAADLMVLPLGTTTFQVTATDLDNPTLFDTATATITVGMRIESPAPGVHLLPIGQDLDLRLRVHGLGTAGSLSLMLDGQTVPSDTVAVTSALLESLGRPSLGKHTLTVEATDASGQSHTATVNFEVVLSSGSDGEGWVVKPESLGPSSGGVMMGFFTLPPSTTSNAFDPTYLDVYLPSIEIEGLATATPSAVYHDGAGTLIIRVDREDLFDANGEIGTTFELRLRFFNALGPRFVATDTVKTWPFDEGSSLP